LEEALFKHKERKERRKEEEREERRKKKKEGRRKKKREERKGKEGRNSFSFRTPSAMLMLMLTPPTL
jgi:hypothetical protein